MDKIEKLFRKISRSDREKLLKIIKQLVKGDLQNLNVKKIRNTNFYRIRSGRYRIIFHYEPGTKGAVIDSIKLRDEKTYKKM